jgi:hypothetical protein
MHAVAALGAKPTPFQAKLHKLARVLYWQQPQHNLIDQRENCGVGADAQGQRQERHGGDAGRPPEHPQPVPDISRQRIHGWQASAISIGFLRRLNIPEFQTCGPACFFRTHAGAKVVLRLHLQVRFDFGLQLSVPH